MYNGGAIRFDFDGVNVDVDDEDMAGEDFDSATGCNGTVDFSDGAGTDAGAEPELAALTFCLSYQTALARTFANSASSLNF